MSEVDEGGMAASASDARSTYLEGALTAVTAGMAEA